ncbi:MAG: hypothetical protein AB7F72_04015 [Afipia sp.]
MILDRANLSQPAIFIAGEKDGVLKIAAEEFEAIERNVPNLTKKVVIPAQATGFSRSARRTSATS